MEGYEDVVRILLDSKADIDSKDGHGQTPPSWASMEDTRSS